jgi:syntaxin 8
MSQSLAKLTSTATQTLSLLLERERAQTFAGPDSGDLGIGLPGLHAAQITRNLNQLRSGVLALEANGGNADASRLLRGQYERMRLMLGEDGAGLEPYAVRTAIPTYPQLTHLYIIRRLTMPTFTTVSQLPDGAASASASPFTDDAAVPPLSSNGGVPRKARDRLGLDDGRASSFAPYSDDPERGPDEPEVSAPQLLQQQRRMMDG